MKLKSNYKALSLIFLILCQYSAFGQTNGYKYKRELVGVKENWHKLELPNELFGKVQADLSDIRIIGLQEGGDTLTVPFIMDVLQEEKQRKEVSFRLLNQSRQGNRHFFTLEVPEIEAINRIGIQFLEKNFDRAVKLEGSQEQNEWFTILEDYRILSIHNAATDYAFTSLHFPSSKYRYYRLSFISDQKPVLEEARLIAEDTEKGKYRTYNLEESTIREDKETKETIIELTLPAELPVSYLELEVKGAFDYYRPITIQYLADSIETAKGWKYYFKTLSAGILSSLEDGGFHFPNTQAYKLRVLIQNQDNNPLSIGGITVKGNVHEIIARFPKATQYYLLYGNAAVHRPNYDLAVFRNKIPSGITELQMGEEQPIEQEPIAIAGPLFQDQRWLWAIMIIIILLLGWFSLKMIRRA